MRLPRIFARRPAPAAKSDASEENFRAVFRITDTSFGPPSPAEVEQAYYLSSIVRGCVDEIIEGFAQCAITAPPLVALLLEEPNETEGRREFFSRLLAAFLTGGAAFVLKRRRAGYIEALSAFAPTQTTIEGTGHPYRPYKAYHFVTNSAHIVAPPRDVIYFRDPHTRRVGHASRLQSCWDEIQLDIQRGRYQRTILANMADASFVTETDEDMTLAQRDMLERSLNRSVGGTRRGAVLVLPKGFRMRTPGVARDLDMPGISSLCESRIAAVLNVPAILVGLRAGLERSTYANYAEARQSFYRETITPLADYFARAFTRGLIRDEQASGDVTITPPAEPDPIPEHPAPSDEDKE